MTDAFICEAVRTPIGRLGGALSRVRPDDLAAIAIRALIERTSGMVEAEIDEVVLGCANQAGEDNRNVARMASLIAGLPKEVPGVTINRLCASGAEAIAIAARSIRAGEADLVLAGGVESMSRAPYVMSKAEAAFGRGQTLEDTTIGWRFVNERMNAQYGTASMAQTAENVAARSGVSREDQDRFAERSQRLAAGAQERGYFSEEIAPVSVASGNSTNSVRRDEHLRPDSDFAALEKLRPVVHSEGTVTAGNASGINDGAAAMWIASEAAAARHGLVPRARILGAAAAGVEPNFMGLGPVPATHKLLDRLGLSISDFDLIEINEAFAAQVIASLRELKIDPMDEVVNPNGGAIALGHPLGMSGARLVLTAVHMLETGGASRALVTMCVGVGQGVSLALERV